jgi:chaperonin GroES
MKLKPVGDRLVVRRDEGEKQTKSGIVLADVAVERPMRGIVVAAGEGALVVGDDGRPHLKPMRIKVGDKVLMGKYAGLVLSLDKVEHVVLREEEVLCVVED